MNDREITINQIAQGDIAFEDGTSWFNDLNETTKKEILQSIYVFLSEAHPTQDEITKGISLSDLKETYTPCVLMKNKPFKEAMHRVLSLPKEEWEKAFILWLSIFMVADKRRRETQCKDGCSHEWHNI